MERREMTPEGTIIPSVSGSHSSDYDLSDDFDVPRRIFPPISAANSRSNVNPTGDGETSVSFSNPQMMFSPQESQTKVISKDFGTEFKDQQEVSCRKEFEIMLFSKDSAMGCSKTLERKTPPSSTEKRRIYLKSTTENIDSAGKEDCERRYVRVKKYSRTEMKVFQFLNGAKIWQEISKSMGIQLCRELANMADEPERKRRRPYRLPKNNLDLGFKSPSKEIESSVEPDLEAAEEKDSVWVQNLPLDFATSWLKSFCPRIVSIRFEKADSVLLTFPSSLMATEACTRLNGYLSNMVAKTVSRKAPEYHNCNEFYKKCREVEVKENSFAIESRSLIIFNVSALITEEDLMLKFLPYGPVTILRFKHQEGFAIIGYGSSSRATKALTLQGSTIGKSLRIISVYRCSCLDLFMTPSKKVIDAFIQLEFNISKLMN